MKTVIGFGLKPVSGFALILAKRSDESLSEDELNETWLVGVRWMCRMVGFIGSQAV